ncbi:MAG TPA: hypothetical protein VGO47_09955 [Chlamydiales bacterium]|nr:hypothetical protein [Chlamydiales bacterium]
MIPCDLRGGYFNADVIVLEVGALPTKKVRLPERDGAVLAERGYKGARCVEGTGGGVIIVDLVVLSRERREGVAGLREGAIAKEREGDILLEGTVTRLRRFSSERRS